MTFILVMQYPPLNNPTLYNRSHLYVYLWDISTNRTVLTISISLRPRVLGKKKKTTFIYKNTIIDCSEVTD